MRKRILITGVNGLVGNLAYRHFADQADRYEVFGMDRSNTMSDRVAIDGGIAIPKSHFYEGDLSSITPLEAMMSGVDTVIHLAADPDGGASWESVLANNIVGTQNTFEAARLAGVSRVIAASSIHVSNGYRRDEPYRSFVKGEFGGESSEIPMVTVDDEPRPTNPYGVSKLAGEATARMYSETHGISSLCLRLGWVLGEDKPPSRGDAPAFCSQRDVVQLIDKSVGAPEDLRFGIYYGLSANRYRWVCLENAKDDLGYEPGDCGDERL